MKEASSDWQFERDVSIVTDFISVLWQKKKNCIYVHVYLLVIYSDKRSKFYY